jgi:hypothetical protein
MPEDRDLAALAGTRVCVNRAIGEAVAVVESPTLTKVYESKMGISAAPKIASLR